jgi:hypothetical protein
MNEGVHVRVRVRNSVFILCVFSDIKARAAMDGGAPLG